MKVAQVSFSTSGGAGRVALNLNDELIRRNVDSRVISVTDKSLWESPFDAPGIALGSAIDEFVLKRRSSGSMLSIARNWSPKKINLEGFEIVHFHWWQGVDVNYLRSLSSDPGIVFTLHDERAFTGGCHSTNGCKKFQTGCVDCPILNPIFRHLATNEFATTRNLFASMRKIVFTVPNAWMVEQAKLANLEEFGELVLVPNPIDNIFYKSSGRLSKAPKEEFVLGFVAQNLRDPNKQLDFAEYVIERLSNRGLRVRLRAVGNGKAIENSLVDYLGPLSSEELINEAITWDGLISTSASETSPLVFFEMALLGLPVISTPNLGAIDTLATLGQKPLLPHSKELLSDEHLKNLISVVEEYRLNPPSRAHLDKHSLKNIASDMLGIYERLEGD